MGLALRATPVEQKSHGSGVDNDGGSWEDCVEIDDGVDT